MTGQLTAPSILCIVCGGVWVCGCGWVCGCVWGCGGVCVAHWALPPFFFFKEKLHNLVPVNSKLLQG